MIRSNKDGGLDFTGVDELCLQRWCRYLKADKAQLTQALTSLFGKGAKKKSDKQTVVEQL